ncbi:MAG: single-stranded DNA-binding protein [Actinomycetota bacterium]|jgi:single-strand DNA-binding protein|nr:single-stranded DNA-binding protein [Actinomycetota bacterium]
MASFNKIQIVGYLGRKPELRYTPSGTAVADLSVATTERRRTRDAAEPEEFTTWFNVTLWGRLAEAAAQYLDKGRLVFVEGRLRQRAWTDRDGNTRTSLEVNGTDLQFIGSRDDGAPQQDPARTKAETSGGTGYPGAPELEPMSEVEIEDSDLPF